MDLQYFWGEHNLSQRQPYWKFLTWKTRRPWGRSCHQISLFRFVPLPKWQARLPARVTRKYLVPGFNFLVRFIRWDSAEVQPLTLLYIYIFSLGQRFVRRGREKEEGKNATPSPPLLCSLRLTWRCLLFQPDFASPNPPCPHLLRSLVPGYLTTWNFGETLT